MLARFLGCAASFVQRSNGLVRNPMVPASLLVASRNHLFDRNVTGLQRVFSTHHQKHPPSESEIAAAKEPKVTPTGYNEFELYPAFGGELMAKRTKEETKNIPIVLISGWLMSKPRHLAHYVELYRKTGRDFDFLVVRPAVKDVIFPMECRKMATRMLDLLSTDEMRGRPVVMHGFSVGGFFFGNMLTVADQNKDEYMHVMNNVRGQVYDSLVDFDGVPNGLGLSMFPTKPALAKMISIIAKIYLFFGHFFVTRHYHVASKYFHENYIKSPSLWFYCTTDPLSSHDAIDEVMAKWRKKGNEVKGVCFESSEHVKHFQNYNQEYIKEVHDFLDRILGKHQK